MRQRPWQGGFRPGAPFKTRVLIGGVLPARRDSPGDVRTALKDTSRPAHCAFARLPRKTGAGQPSCNPECLRQVTGGPYQTWNMAATGGKTWQKLDTFVSDSGNERFCRFFLKLKQPAKGKPEKKPWPVN